MKAYGHYFNPWKIYVSTDDNGYDYVLDSTEEIDVVVEDVCSFLRENVRLNIKNLNKKKRSKKITTK